MASRAFALAIARRAKHHFGMTALLSFRPAAALLIAVLSLGLSACDEVAALGGPTHQYILQADIDELAASEGGADRTVGITGIISGFWDKGKYGINFSIVQFQNFLKFTGCREGNYKLK